MLKYFKLSEFNCHDGTPYPDIWKDRLNKISNICDLIRAKIDCPLYINSAYRTQKHNTKIGGAPNSMHLQGIAVDLKPLAGTTAKQLHEVIIKMINDKEIPDGGVGLYDSFVHYDCRTILGFKPARWDKA